MTLLRWSRSPKGAGLPLVEAKRRGETITRLMKIRECPADELEPMIGAWSAGGVELTQDERAELARRRAEIARGRG